MDAGGSGEQRGARAGDVRGTVRALRFPATGFDRDACGRSVAQPVRWSLGAQDRRLTGTRWLESKRDSRMHVRHMQVTDFRSWRSLDLPLQPGPVVLVGPNGRGKTNLLEALGYVATLGSHRVSNDTPLVRRDAQRALIRVLVVNQGRELSVELEIAPGQSNRARINRGALGRPRDALGILRTVLFSPEDLALVRGDPAQRRRFLDELLVLSAPRYAGVRSDYERVLRQRNALLKTTGKRGSQADQYALSTLDVWDRQLAESGAELLAGRLKLVAELAGHTSAGYATLAPESDTASIAYRCSLGARLPAG